MQSTHCCKRVFDLLWVLEIPFISITSLTTNAPWSSPIQWHRQRTCNGWGTKASSDLIEVDMAGLFTVFLRNTKEEISSILALIFLFTARLHFLRSLSA